ncbi:Beta-xylosidase [Posidoniimonas corsicana]|uniref:Beta-xylosidase n=1 Tax=Posidoniimonas corsicana TaxID=1938618 RepID=A0A5C5UVP3_9BACT|nr:glycoside hydrolase 43 family protein [Posidoniimonas corsicana]TWT29607.1 Beta-xylosidase [Posidoniimonas corsicana]
MHLTYSRSVLLLLTVVHAAPATEPAGHAQNPIIWADVPDMAILRVGDAYYMSSTTMHMSPGVPIMKSHDLVDWKLVGYAYDTLDDVDALNLEDGKSAYGAGSWASSLRLHDGVYYLATFSGTTGKTYVYTTRDIEKGPWKKSSFRPMLHDNSLFFDDDGRVYMIHAGGDIRLIELTPDASAIKPGGVDRVIIPNASAVAGGRVGLRAEGSQMIKHNGRYYLFNITWPRGDMRTQIVHRADKITGPYEGRVALHDQGVAQGTIVDTPEGDWYAFIFQDHGAVGRTPWLVPVRWMDGWPIHGVDGKAPRTLDLPADPDGLTGIVDSDEFDRSTGDPPLPLAWQWNHNPVENLWSLTERPGWLRLTSGRVDSGLVDTRNTLTQRTFGPECSATVALDASGMADGDSAGLALLQRKYGWVGVQVEGDAKSIVAVAAEDDQPRVLARLPLDQPVVYLRASCDFKDRADKGDFAYSLDGESWESIGAPLSMEYTLPHFMGYRFALFNFATKSPGGHADFGYFRVSDSIDN